MIPFAITLFCEDLAASADFYRAFLDAEPVFGDDDSTVFRLEGLLVNLLREAAVDELIAPAAMAAPGARAVYTLKVEDVDAMAEALAARGIALLNGPMNRPWGPRTASVQDPSGHIWEISGPARP